MKNSLLAPLILGGAVVVAVARLRGHANGPESMAGLCRCRFGRTRVRQPADCASGMQ